MRHGLVGGLTLAACAVLAGATSLLAIGVWIADAPLHILEHVGVHPDPLFPKRFFPAETTVRRLPAGSTATPWTERSAAGSRTAAAAASASGAAWRSTGRACTTPPGPQAARSTCSPPSTTAAA
ncbi:hypothetical protein [Streptomyces sp. CA-106110]|uniref:hypothetical protein n=1 Tax=Streptomyces sp. CA-106110 TaxID=3240044 RepID=UPI003D8C8B99